MSRLWVRWALLAAFVVAIGVTFVNLGQWQLDRLDQRRDRNELVVEHESMPVQEFADVFGRPVQEADQWLRVRVTGSYDAAHQLQVRYRSFDGTTGWEIVTPLTTPDGQTVLVNRGYRERPAREDFPKVLPEPPSGEVTVVGYVRRNEQGSDVAMTPTEGTVRLINSAALSAWLGRPLVDGYLGLIESDPAQSGDFRPVTPPPLTEGPHLSYALQWFAFAAIAGFGFFVLIRNDIRDGRRAKARAAREAATTAEPGRDT